MQSEDLYDIILEYRIFLNIRDGMAGRYFNQDNRLLLTRNPLFI
jgi:hypothetical protein